jgi:hypothetical protein
VPGCTSNCDVDYLICTHCAPDRDRAVEFTCSADDLGDGKCRIILFGNNPVDLIEEGSGPIATIDYDVSEDAPSSNCIDITPADSMASDRFGNPLFVVEEADELCFIVCGDVYPRGCLGQCQCGDGVVDIFDILEEVDFALEVTSPSDCQLLNADVPTGQSPYCSERDGIIDIFDILVLLDMALGKYNNCCDDIFFPCVYC